MARLSAENFRRGTDRKSSNPFTKMFSKSPSRLSMAEEGSEAEAASKSSTTSSPRTYRQLKEGFTKVGLWPSDRPPSASSMKQDQGSTEVSSPQSYDTSSSAVAAQAGRTDKEAKNSTSVSASSIPRTWLADGDSDITAVNVGCEGRQKRNHGNTSTSTNPAEISTHARSVFTTEAPYRMISTGSRQVEVAAETVNKDSQSPESTGRIGPLPSFKWKSGKDKADQNGISRQCYEADGPAKSRIDTQDRSDQASVAASDESTILHSTKSGVLNTLHTEVARCFYTYSEADPINSYQITSYNTPSLFHRAQLCFWLCVVIGAALCGPQGLLKLLWYIGIFAMLSSVGTVNMGGKLDRWDMFRIPFRQVFCDIPSAMWREIAFKAGHAVGGFVAGFEAGYNNAEVTCLRLEERNFGR